jgi:pSer/pThr/pTyr-binding forkhead associated (FHA) protein
MKLALEPATLPAIIVALTLLAVGIVILLGLVVLWRRRRVTPAPPSTACIPYLKSPDEAVYFRLDKLGQDGLVIGRSKNDADLVIDDKIPYADTVSERHARIYYDLTCGYMVIEDLESDQGIFINGRRAPRKNLLRDGWTIGLGTIALVYRDGESDTGPLG